jgi:hypothetical protein
MNRFMPALLLIAVCSLSFGVAYAADAPPADSDERQSVSVTAPQEGKSNTHLSLAGLGSVFWAARHPAQAWRVLAPIQPDGVAYADIRAKCAFTNATNGEAACP